MKITDEMVEAAAREIWKAGNTTLGVAPPDDMEAWENETEGYLELARVALEAALAVVSEEMIADELKRHHFIHGLSRRNSCHCGVKVGEFEQYRNHEAQAILALFRGGAK